MIIEQVEIILALLAVMSALVAIARRIHVAYPILLVIGGLLISFIPGLPKIELNPDIVFILFLPPIIQQAAFELPTRDFRANLRSIGVLAIWLVLVTMVVIAIVAHNVIGLPWASAFVLGAIVAPPDAVAANSIMPRLNLPRRVMTVLEGESLLNDATSLVAYRVAVAAVVSGMFSLVNAGVQFLLSSVGGILVGVVIGMIMTPISRRLTDDPPVYIILSFLSGYAAYLLANTIGVSGVLAVVALGVVYLQPRFDTRTPELRLQTFVVWNIVVFLLNGLIFILIGLQLRGIIGRLSSQSFATLLWYAAIICLTLILVRIAWVFLARYLPGLLTRNSERDPLPSWQDTLVVAWTGMRGVVSLASALALPLVTDSGKAFPGYSVILFLTFAVILVTLVLQGLSLPFLIRWLHVTDDGSAKREENEARLKVALAGQQRFEELVKNNEIDDRLAEKLRPQYDARIRHLTKHYQGTPDEDEEQHMSGLSHIFQEIIEAETSALVDLRNKEIINDEVMRKVQRDLDLQWLRLEDKT